MANENLSQSLNFSVKWHYHDKYFFNIFAPY